MTDDTTTLTDDEILTATGTEDPSGMTVSDADGGDASDSDTSDSDSDSDSSDSDSSDADTDDA